MKLKDTNLDQNDPFPKLHDIIKAMKTLVWHLSREPMKEISSFIKQSVMYDKQVQANKAKDSLSPAIWHDKHTYLSSLGMLGITQLNSILFADHITSIQWIYETCPYKAENDK